MGSNVTAAHTAKLEAVAKRAADIATVTAAHTTAIAGKSAKAALPGSGSSTSVPLDSTLTGGTAATKGQLGFTNGKVNDLYYQVQALAAQVAAMNA
jgi:hypothetical protein